MKGSDHGCGGVSLRGIYNPILSFRKSCSPPLAFVVSFVVIFLLARSIHLAMAADADQDDVLLPQLHLKGKSDVAD